MIYLENTAEQLNTGWIQHYSEGGSMMKPDLMNVIRLYNYVVRGVEDTALEDDTRAYGGVIRAKKGQLVETIARRMVEIAWEHIGGNQLRLSMDRKTVKVPIDRDYVRNIPDAEIKRYIKSNIDGYFYRIRPDLCVHIDGNLINLWC